jgi:hypothetical protein
VRWPSDGLGRRGAAGGKSRLDEDWVLGPIDDALELGLAVDHTHAHRFKGGAIRSASESETASFPSCHERGGGKKFVA